MKIHEITSYNYVTEGSVGMSELIRSAAKGIGVGAALYEYYTIQSNLSAQLSANKITKQQYDAELYKQRAVIYTQLGVIIASGVLVNTVSKILSVCKFLPFGGLLSKVIAGGGVLITVPVIAYVSTPAGRDALSNLLTEGLINGVSSTFKSLLKDFIEALKNTVPVATALMTGKDIPPSAAGEPEKYAYTRTLPNGEKIAYNTSLPAGYEGPLH